MAENGIPTRNGATEAPAIAGISQFSLLGKVAAVTGGAKGIGLEVVRGLAEAGADVAIIYATSKATDILTEKLASVTGRTIRAYQSDVRKRSEIAATLQAVEADFGRLDIVVANSGVCADIPCLEYTEETWSANNSVNIDGVMWTAQAAGKIFQRQRSGSLIITASVSATLVNVPQRQAAYNASKAAAVHLGKSLAVEWVQFGARVNMISPGFIETEMVLSQPKERFDDWIRMIPARRMAKASELRAAYIFLASDACPYMTGADIIIDGGYTLT